jgi:osmotically-inducible protein OsmY
MKNKINTLCLVLCLGLSTAAITAVTGCAGNKNDRSTGQYVDDKSVGMRVRSALGDSPDYKFSDVNVDVFRGTVQLSGFVNSSAQKSKAADIAKGVEGVKDVANNISVKETQ